MQSPLLRASSVLLDEADGTIRLTYSGSGEQAQLRVLLAKGCEPVAVCVQENYLPATTVNRRNYSLDSKE